MSTELLDELKQRAAALTAQEKTELAAFLNERLKRDGGAQAADGSAAEDKAAMRQRRMAWLKTHREEYGGQYVALDGDRLLGTGESYPEAAAAARRAGVNDAYVDYVCPPDYEGYMGGW